ncbi:hypothetical protein [Planococcus lenghuensis]|uniref:Uncharacterized protein n=1 Tax=Planococcus lenghuensis TaxID=2213202 RepID=A0A1Q2L5Y8_9BACL|nr:hypothetical protein [Planococcus lenghuensis]AQQ55332.1 hypothetical protein B0X71_19350 [Planococcus lenghuensis]
MDMHIEQFYQALEVFESLHLAKIAADYGMPREKLNQIDLYPAYEGSSNLFENFLHILNWAFDLEDCNASKAMDINEEMLMGKLKLYPSHDEGKNTLERFYDCTMLLLKNSYMRDMPEHLADEIKEDGENFILGRTDEGLVVIVGDIYDPRMFHGPLKTLLAYQKEALQRREIA